MRRWIAYSLFCLLPLGFVSMESWAVDESRTDVAGILARAQSNPNADEPFMELHSAPREAVLDELIRNPIDLRKRPYGFISAYYRMLAYHQAAARPEIRKQLYDTLRDPNWSREAATALGRAPSDVLPEVITQLVDELSPDAFVVGSTGLRGEERDNLASKDRELAVICSAAIRRNLEQIERAAGAEITRTLRRVTTVPTAAITVCGTLLAAETWIAIRSGSTVEAELDSLRTRPVALRVETTWELLTRGNLGGEPPEFASLPAWEFRRETCRQIHSIFDPKLRAQALIYCLVNWPQSRRFQDGRVVADPEFLSLVRSFLIDPDPLVVAKSRELLNGNRLHHERR